MLKFLIHQYALQPAEDEKYIKEEQTRRKMLQKNIKPKILKNTNPKIQKNTNPEIQKIQENINIKMMWFGIVLLNCIGSKM
jgi:hypothetical protein